MILARKMRDGPWRISNSLCANPTTNSGASSAVNANLKARVAENKSGTTKVVKMKGKPAKDRLCRVCKVTTMYVKVMKTHSSSGLGMRKVLTVSGSPANFWPVWFQLLMSLRAARAIMWLDAERMREDLEIVSCEQEQEGRGYSLTVGLLWRRGKLAIL